MDSLRCPLTKKQFQDPVMGADGYTYERNAIIEWLEKHGTSPLTQEPMNVQSLKKNRPVAAIIQIFSLPHDQFQLNVDIWLKTNKPLFNSSDKTIYELECMRRQGPPIVSVEIKGLEAIREASFYVYLSCHPHIIRTFGFVKSDSKSTQLLQEYASVGHLAELLQEHRFRPSEDVLIEIFVQICDAMVCLADNDIVHGDLACRNVLVFRSNAMEPEENLVKLTDFGLARGNTIYSVDDNTTSSTTIVIPVRYAAPEILRTMDTSNYSEKSDIYSMGVLMWEAFSLGTMPYASIEDDREVRNRKLKKEKLPQPSCSRHLWNIMSQCWRSQPENRPDFRKLKQSLLILQLSIFSKEKNLIDNEISVRYDFFYEHNDVHFLS
jgi:serine/threonine protein kinase